MRVRTDMEMKMIEFIPVTNFGQIKQGEVLVIEKTNGVKFVAVAKKVLNKGKTTEEIIINLGGNDYFIMSLFLEGKSWVKSVIRLLDVEITCITNNMKEFIKH